MRLTSLVLMSAVVVASGCSFALQHHHPDGMIRGGLSAESCSSSRALPWVDIGIMSVGIAGGLIGEGIHDGIGVRMHQDAGTITAGTSLLVAMLALASADVGFGRAKACQTDAHVAVR